jgi:hypothetical protein
MSPQPQETDLGKQAYHLDIQMSNGVFLVCKLLIILVLAPQGGHRSEHCFGSLDSPGCYQCWQISETGIVVGVLLLRYSPIC